MIDFWLLNIESVVSCSDNNFEHIQVELLLANVRDPHFSQICKPQNSTGDHLVRTKLHIESWCLIHSESVSVQHFLRTN